jgi:hypothetical protein
LIDFFNERRTGFDWLRKAGIYDLLLFIVGLPFALVIVYEVSSIIEKLQLPMMLTSGLYVYAFFVGLYIFRGLFTYLRWVFPKIEIESDTSPPLHHRALWLLIILGIPGAVFGEAIWDAIKALR